MSCPDEGTLRAFSLGNLSAADLEVTAHHIESCGDCGCALEKLDGCTDGLVAHLSRMSGSETKFEQRLSGTAASELSSSTLTLDPGRSYARMLAEGTCQIGRFVLQSELGDGSFGCVFRAHDPDLDRTVAIKIQRVGSLAGDDDVRRFHREAQSAAQLQHPGIVALYETGQTEDDVCFLVTEYVEGETLEDRISAGRFPPREAAELTAEIADALNYAHEHKVIHRDIKPSNILIDVHQRPHIADFGLAKRVTADQTVTSDGRIMGTPAYMSPEQARGNSTGVDARSDVYSLGVMFYELLTGERPFQGNRRLVMLQVLEEEPRAPRQLDDHIPRDLETICLKAMEKSGQRRYQSASELSQDLHRFLNGTPILARPTGLAERIWRWGRSNPVAASLLTAVSVGSIVGFWYLSLLSTWFVEQTALDSVRGEAVMFEGVRDHYSEHIVDRLDKKKVPVQLNWMGTDDTLPFPAPYLIEVGNYVSKGKSGVSVHLHGLHPWRPRPPKDEFQLTALRVLTDRAQQDVEDLSYYEFRDSNGRSSLRYAKGQIMKDSCVRCHNNSDASPKRDWRPGDLVGILEVTRPLDREIERTRQGLRGAFLLVGSTGLALAVLSFGLVASTRARTRRKVNR